jgi:hypothetical protein
MKRLFTSAFIAFLFVLSAVAKNETRIIMQWPPEKPALKLSFEKFRQQSSYAGQKVYLADVTVENITEKQIPPGEFHRLLP